MTCRGIRGAITIDNNHKDDIIAGTIRVLKKMMDANGVTEPDIVSIFFSVTEDLNATFPAKAARDMNLSHTPLLCFHEIRVPNGLEKCIRILMHVNSDTPIQQINHIYLEKSGRTSP